MGLMDVVTEPPATRAELARVSRDIDALDSTLRRELDARTEALRRDIEETQAREETERRAIGAWELSLEAVSTNYFESNVALLGPGIRGEFTLLDPLRIMASI